MRYTENSPCTNVPIHCPICPTVNNTAATIWKYNAWIHLASEHGRLKKLDLPPKFMIDIFISKREAWAMSTADEDTVKRWRDANEMPNSDDIQMSERSGPSNKRERAASNVTKEPKSKRRVP